MKIVLSGVGLLISGIILYGMRLITGAILAQYSGFHSLDTGLAMIGPFPKYFTFSLIILGIFILIIGLIKED
jgi:hypothetical protein